MKNLFKMLVLTIVSVVFLQACSPAGSSAQASVTSPGQNVSDDKDTEDGDDKEMEDDDKDTEDGDDKEMEDDDKEAEDGDKDTEDGDDKDTEDGDVGVPDSYFSGALTNPATTYEIEYEQEVIAASFNPFIDVDPNALEGKASIYLYQNDILKGFEDKTFRGDDKVTRAGLSKLAVNMMGWTVPDHGATETAGFSDIIPGDWYVKYVKKAVAEKMLKGYVDGTFGPANPVTVAEAVKIIGNGWKLEKNAPYTVVDAGSNDWFVAEGYAGMIEKYDLMPHKNLSTTKKIKPDEEMTRYDVAVIIYQAAKSR